VRFPLSLARIALLATLPAAVLLPPPADAGTPDRFTALSASEPSRQIQLLQERLQRYRDGQIRSARRVSLQQALHEGLAAHPQLNRAYATIEEAVWSVQAVRRAWWPQLSVGSDDPGLVGWTTTTTRERIRSGGVVSRVLSIRGGQAAVPNLTLEWTFFDPARAARTNAARSELMARRFLFDVDARDLILQIQQAFYALQEQAELEQDYRRLYQTVSDLLEARLPSAADPGHVDQLLTQRLALLNLRIRAHDQVIQAAAALAEALNLPPGELVMPAEPLSLQGRWQLPLPETIHQALALREEIQASLARAGGDAWSARARQRSNLPTLSLTGQLSGSTENFSSGSLIGASQATTSLNREVESQVGLGFDWTIFDGGIKRAEADALRSRARASLAQAELERLSIMRQVRDSHAAMITSLIVVDTAAEQLAEADRSLAAASRDYRSGRSDATRVVQTISALRDAADSYRGAVRRHNTAIAGLYRHSARWPEGTLPLVIGSYPPLPAGPVPPSPPGSPAQASPAAASWNGPF
jgi:outer membrane protein TolC